MRAGLSPCNGRPLGPQLDPLARSTEAGKGRPQQAQLADARRSRENFTECSLRPAATWQYGVEKMVSS